MSLSTLCSVSRLIRKLVENGYFADDSIDLSILLQNIDIHESDVSLLNASQMVTTFGIVRTLTICDELCAPYIINVILLQNVTLDKVMDNHVINTGIISMNEYIQITNNGYKVVVEDNSKYYHGHSCMNISDINNAFYNGACIWTFDTNLIRDQNNVFQFSQSVASEITHFVSYGITDAIYEILPHCKNIEHVEISNYDLNKLNYEKNIKCIVSTYVTETHLYPCVNLRELDASHNYSITSCEHVAHTLRILNAYRTHIDNNGVRTCSKIKSLTTSIYITTCKPFANTLVKLCARNYCVSDAGLLCCTRIKILDASNNPCITTCDPFAKTLRYLAARCACGISNTGLTHCYKIKTLDIRSNPKIDTIAHFTLLKRFTYNLVIQKLEEEISMRKHLRVSKSIVRKQ